MSPDGNRKCEQPKLPVLGTVVVKVKLTRVSLTLCESLFYPANAEGRAHTHTHTFRGLQGCRSCGENIICL